MNRAKDIEQLHLSRTAKMKSLESEVPPFVWDDLYDRQNTPWRSGGLTKATRRLLSTHPDGRRLLEVGCGTGDDAIAIAKMGFDYHGIDVSEVAIRLAKETKNHSTLDFACADFFQWDAREPFHVIYEKGLFHGLAGTRQRNRFIRRVASQLTPNGVWISVCGSADQQHRRFPHGAIYLRDLVGPAEVYFEILEIQKANYGLADHSRDFPAWHSAFRRYAVKQPS
jgi:SAM-dependent methyltransferase